MTGQGVADWHAADTPTCRRVDLSTARVEPTTPGVSLPSHLLDMREGWHPTCPGCGAPNPYRGVS